MSDFAPAREDGMKPWVRMSYHLGGETSQIVYAQSALDAKHMYGRVHLEIVRVRRATPEDLAKKELEQSLVATRNALIGTQRVRDDYKARAERAERERDEALAERDSLWRPTADRVWDNTLMDGLDDAPRFLTDCDPGDESDRK